LTPILLTLVARTPLPRLRLVVTRASVLAVLFILVRLGVFLSLLIVHSARIAFLIAHLQSSGRLRAIAPQSRDCATP
jgi:hypothetical protein